MILTKNKNNMQKISIKNIENMLTIFIDNLETIQRLEMLSHFIPSFETVYKKNKRNKYFNDLLVYLIKSEIIIELAYEHALSEAEESEFLFQICEEKYRWYLEKIIYLIYLYNFLIMKSLENNQLISNLYTIFRH